MSYIYIATSDKRICMSRGSTAKVKSGPCAGLHFAGTTKSNDCTIIFCEGDSAKAGIVSGLSKDDRN